MGFWSAVGDLIEGAVKESRAPEAIDNFDGSNKMYGAKQTRYLYQDNDLKKAYDFEEYVCNKYPDKEFCNEDYGLALNIRFFYHGYQTQQLGLIPYMKMTVDESDTLEYYCESIAGIVVAAYLCDIFAVANYQMLHFVYDYNMDCEQMSKLVERFDGASERDQRKIERKINALQKKYHERLGDIAYYVQSIIDISDVDHIVSNINEHAGKYAGYMDEIYTHVLDNAIRIHNATYLQNMYPTEAQKQSFRGQIQKEMINKMRSGLSNLNSYNKHAATCLNMCSKMYELQAANSEDNFWSKGALSLALGFISGPMGIGYAMKEGYKAHNREEEYERIGEMLNEELEKLVDEYSRLTMDLCTSAEALIASLTNHVSKKYLYAALNSIFKKLQAQGVQLRPVYEYFK